MSLVLTVLLCIFWTIPVAFVASISNVESLTDLMPFLKEPVENYAWFSTALALLAPLLLVIFISFLPTILLMFVKLECLIDVETMHHPSLFSKLATFTILQTFFIVSKMHSVTTGWFLLSSPFFSLGSRQLHQLYSHPYKRFWTTQRAASNFFRRPFHHKQHISSKLSSFKTLCHWAVNFFASHPLSQIILDNCWPTR